jgi:hypothetical protein
VTIGYKISRSRFARQSFGARLVEGSAGLVTKVSHSLCELHSVIKRSGVHSDCEQKKFSRIVAISKSSDITRRILRLGDCIC